MLDLLAAIQSADPPSLVLWSLFVFAAGMYPIGFMLGSTCSPCCNQNPCSLCTTGSLPDTVTVTFDGFTDQTPGPDLIALSFSACFGGGASARVTAPGGDPDTDKGPISAVSLTSAGSGYAKLGRVAPTLTVSGGSGTGATFTPTLTSSNDACGVPSWTISSVAVKDGTGYVDGETLTVTIAEGDTEATAASVIINTTITQPTLTASVATGSGAVLSVTLGENSGSPPTWYVASVSVLDGGSGYTDWDYVEFSSDGVPFAEATAYILTGRQAPTLSGGVSGTGSGAALTPTLTQFTDYYTGLPYWSVTGFNIADGGAGYSELDPVFITVDDGIDDSWYPFSAFVASVDENGAITDIWIDVGGSFYKSDGVIQSVVLTYGGMYGGSDNGVPASVTVQNGGGYYREDASEPPYVADITISITQTAPSDGAGAEITATVDDDTSSPTFGRITGLTIEDGGADYLAWKWISNACCGWQLNGMPIVLKRGGEDRSPCRYWHRICGGWRSEMIGQVMRRSNGVMGIAVDYNGPSAPPTVSIIYTGVIRPDSTGSDDIGPACAVTMTAAEPIANCDSFSFSAENIHGVTATVSPGGDYDANFKGKHGSASVPYTRCTQCCQGADDIPQEIEVYVEHNRYRYLAGPRQGAEPETFLTGTYVLPGGGISQSWGLSIPLTETGSEVFSIGISISPDLCGSSETNTGWIDGCDNCVKRCAILGGCAIYRYPGVWYYPPDQDMRYCRIYYDPSLTIEERGEMWCQEFCFDVPLCSPPPGMEFSSFLPYQSENFSDEGCPNCCEPNVSEEATIPGSGHLNTFKMTVQ